MHWRRKWQPTSVFLPGEPKDGGAWRAAVYGITQSDMTEVTWQQQQFVGKAMLSKSLFQLSANGWGYVPSL